MRILNASESSILVYIDTSNCILNSDQSYDYILDDPIFIPRGYNILTSLASAEIPYSFYSTNQYNNFIRIFHSGSGLFYDYSFPDGNYTPYKLKSLLENFISTFDNQSTITYDSFTNRFTFSHSGPHTNTIYWNISNSRVLFGFSASPITYSNVNPVTSDLVCNLNYTSSLFLVTNLTDRGSIDSFTNKTSNILQKIPINTQPRGIIYYTYSQNAHKILYHTTLINKINFSLVDDNRRPINLNGLGYSISILFDFVHQEDLKAPLSEEALGAQATIEPIDVD